MDDTLTQAERREIPAEPEPIRFANKYIHLSLTKKTSRKVLME